MICIGYDYFLVIQVSIVYIHIGIVALMPLYGRMVIELVCLVRVMPLPSSLTLCYSCVALSPHTKSTLTPDSDAI
jgi:hypothetical protein